MNKKVKPIAIVGIGCRFPGHSSTPDKFWETMISKTDAIRDVPADRWDTRKFYSGNDARPGKIRALQGGFLHENILEFDPMFFNMSPRECESLDPQQRMLLELVYEAVEDAGITLEALKGSRTGVFIGGFIPDNLISQGAADNKYHIDSHTIGGAAVTMLSNRLSYCFDLRGPSIYIDTACSSSLVATHYACQSIWNEESTMAIVGGANYMLSPQSSILVSKGKFMSFHGRCKAFDSDAGGYVRGEGAGIVILKDLEQAVKDHDHIYATIVGTGVNQDGRTNGITVPNGDAQLQLMNDVYKRYQINSQNIHYVEAHGTGTPVGDPIEFKSLNEALSDNGYRENKCLVGSVKTNIGHLEGASGIAGLIKATLCLHNNAVPPNLHFNHPNPALNYEHSNLRVPTGVETLPANEDSFASINSFGFGGTNAHVVLKQFNGRNGTAKGKLKTNHFIFPISAKSVTALKELAGKYSDYINAGSVPFDQVLSNAIYRRSNFSTRLAVYATGKEDLVEKLSAYKEDIVLKGVNQGNALNNPQKLVFVYTGMGPQWWKMGREMMKKEKVFRKAVHECDAVFKQITGWSVYEELVQPVETSKIKETYIAQPANFVIQVALTRLLEHYGIVPDAVVGHSVGEIASTYISGALSLEEALLVSYHRSRLQHTTAGKGSMLAVGLPEADLADLLKQYPGVSVAAINSPRSLTLSGDTPSLNELAKTIEAMGVFCKPLEVAVPYHSPVMNEIRNELLAALEKVKGAETKIRLYSTVTGGEVAGNKIDADYWWQNVRQPVLFAKALDTIVHGNYNIFIEIGPHPVLKNSMMECVGSNKDISFLQTLNRNEPEQLCFYDNMAKLVTLGYPVKWNAWIDKLPYAKLPAYPWQREYLWKNAQQKPGTGTQHNGSILPGAKVDTPFVGYEFEINELIYPFLKHHIVHGKVIFPGAGYISLATAMYQLENGPKLPLELSGVKFHRVLPINDDAIQKMYISYDPKNGQYSIQAGSGIGKAYWTEMSTGKFTIGNFETVPPAIDLPGMYSRLPHILPEQEVYERLSRYKLDYGPHFRCIKEIHLGNKELVAAIKLHPAYQDSIGEYLVHPTLLDACFQTTITLFNGEVVPVSAGRISCYAHAGEDLRCYSKLKFADKAFMIADLVICNEQGEICMRIEDFKCRQLVNDGVSAGDIAKNLYRIGWLPKDIAETPVNAENNTVTYIFTADAAAALPLQQQLNKAVIVEHGSAFKKINEHHFRVNFAGEESMAGLALPGDGGLDMVLIFPLIPQDNEPHRYASEKCLDQLSPLLNIVKKYCIGAEHKTRLNIITGGTQVVNENDPVLSPEISPIHGLARSIVNEVPNCHVRLIDLQPMPGNDNWHMVAGLINGGDAPYEELAVRNGLVFQKNAGTSELAGQQATKRIPFQSEPLQIKMAAQDHFYIEQTNRAEPAQNEIEILIDNTSVGYDDYLRFTNRSTGTPQEEGPAGNHAGCACVGTVMRTGPGVSTFKEGDKVLAFAPGTLQTFTVTSEWLAVKCPAGATAAAAAYVTAIYCLRDKARLQKGDRILIHDAAGLIGMAAVHYARLVGAEIFATAATDQQAAYLNSMGVHHVFDSGSLDYSSAIREMTGGVDVLLCASPGEVMHQNFLCLAPYGIYLDLGKKSSGETPAQEIAFTNNNFTYVSVDTGRLLVDKPQTISALLADVAAYLDSGSLPSLPVDIFPVEEIAAAFETFGGNNTGAGVMIDYANREVEVAGSSNSIKPGGTYLVTGGTKGLGLEVAKWLVAQGAKNIALLSRSGLNGATAEVDAMRKNGANVQAYAADVAQFDELKKVFGKINDDLPPLAGVFHGAMVLDDGFITDMTIERFRTSLRPKVDGAMNLHYLTRDTDLDFFILFSSISSLIGNMGQANYVAANAFLDSFAYWRRNMGLAATTINLGALAESGVVARSENLAQLLEGSGINGISNNEVMQALELAIKERPVQIGFFDLNRSLFFRNAGKSGQALFSGFGKEQAGDAMEHLSEKQVGNRKKLLELEPAVKQDFVTELLQQQLGRILKMSTEHISLDKGINLLGIDSILTVEFMGAIRENLSVELPPIEFLTGPSLKQLSAKIVKDFF